MRRASLTAALMLASSLTALPALSTPASAQTVRDVALTSFDGTKIAVHFYPTPKAAGRRAPVVMVAHGFGESAPQPDQRLAGAPRVDALLGAGYHVLTWDARGHGASGGTSMFDSPDHEVRDTRLVIDWVARQPEVLLDGPGDPRLGMTGASYGGIIQFATAARDRRVDVITPSYTAWSLSETSISRHGKLKEGWVVALAAMGATNLPAGLLSPLGPSLHLLDPAVVTAMLGSLTTGTVGPELRTYLDYRSPSSVLGKVRIPTYIQGGTSDGLFPLVNAVRDFTGLKDRGVPVKLAWNCEGHSLCPGETGPLHERFDSSIITWFDRWLKRDRAVSTGAPFSWIADNEGHYRTARMFPPRTTGALTGSGSGMLTVAATAPASSTSFILTGAQPAAVGLTVPVAPPSREVDVVGFPRLTLAYQGTAAPSETWLYAHVLDQVTGRVVGAQATPVPVMLDGAPHVATLDLEAIATRATPGSRYALQLYAGSAIFGAQRSTGTVEVTRATLALPTVDPSVGPRLRLLRATPDGRHDVRVAFSSRVERYHGVHVVLQRRSHGTWRRVDVVRVGSPALGVRRLTLRSDAALTGSYRVRLHGVDAYGRAVTRTALLNP